MFSDAVYGLATQKDNWPVFWYKISRVTGKLLIYHQSKPVSKNTYRVFKLLAVKLIFAHFLYKLQLIEEIY